MNKIRSISAIILAAPLVVFGANFFVCMFDVPPSDGPGGQDLLQAMRDGGLMSAVAIAHVAAGVMLIVPRTRFLGGLVQLPATIAIVSLRVTMMPEGLPVALAMLALNIGAIADKQRLLRLVPQQFDRPAFPPSII